MGGSSFSTKSLIKIGVRWCVKGNPYVKNEQ